MASQQIPLASTTSSVLLPADGQAGILSTAQPKRRRNGRKSMSRRSGQNGTIVIQSGWYRVRWRMDVENQEARLNLSEKVAPVILDKEGKPKPPSQEVRRLARDIVEKSGANSKEHFERTVLGVETFKERAEAWLRSVQTRRNGKYKTSTLPTIEGALRKHIYPVIGDLPLTRVNNQTCKPLVTAMFESGLGVCSTNNYMKLVLQIVRSLKDTETGEPIYRLKWNREYLDLPKIVKDEQNVPTLTVEQVNQLMKADGQELALYVVLASTGMRIGEALGLEVRHILNGGRTIKIEQSVNRFGKLADGGKTKSASREVDVDEKVAQFLLAYINGKDGLLFKTRKSSPHLDGNILKRWLVERLGHGLGWHSFRRYRITWLEENRAHGLLKKIWVGHALGDITEEYARSIKRNVKLRLEEAERVGTGFDVPAYIAPKCSENSEELELELVGQEQ
jgi:integrase